jgi:hypothetical protein
LCEMRIVSSVKLGCYAYLCLCTSSSTCSKKNLSLAQGELLSGLLQAKIERDELTTLFVFHVLLNMDLVIFFP